MVESGIKMALEELQGVIKRCQGLPETEFKEEDHNIFQSAARQCLEDGHAAELLKILQDKQNGDFVICMGWNLLGPVVNCILRNEQQIENVEICSKIIDRVIEISNPKELLLGLLEQIEDVFENN